MDELSVATVLRKTQAGVMALKERSTALTHKSRMTLIMVDGLKSVYELTRFSPDPPHAVQTLQDLLAAGFVEAAIAARSAQVSAQSVAQGGQSDITASIRRTVKLLEGLLGPSAEPLSMQVEKCRTQEELVLKVQSLRRVVAGMHSEKKADEFVAAALGG